VKNYSTSQAAKLLVIGRDSLQRWLRDGKITGPRVTQVGGVRVRLWTLEDVRRVRLFMSANYCKGRGRKPKEAKRE
jgi:excisionase family DNA binding protein